MIDPSFEVASSEIPHSLAPVGVKDSAVLQADAESDTEKKSRTARMMLDSLFSSRCKPQIAQSYRPRVAIIGAGVTGVAAACQCLDSGFDVTIFEANSRKNLGGIWTVSKPNPEHPV